MTRPDLTGPGLPPPTGQPAAGPRRAAAPGPAPTGPGTGPAGTGPTRPGPVARVDRWSDWRRSWLITAAVLCWVFTFVAIWAVYAATHLEERYVQADPGAAVVQEQRRFQVLRMRQTEVIMDGEDAVPSPANTVYVVADMELTLLGPTEIIACELPLVAAGNRTWTPETFYSKEPPTWCDPDDIKVGKPFAYQLIYQVPVKFADQVYGLAIEDPTSPAPLTVLRP